MDWSDEVRARLVREEERLRYKAANLQARGKTVMAAQELVVADDIRAALGEIEQGRKARVALQEALGSHNVENPWLGICAAVALLQMGRKDAEAWFEEAQAEVERLREALESIIKVQDDQTIWPAYSNEKGKRMGAAIENARTALRGGGE